MSDPTVETQAYDMACGPACGVMLAADRGIHIEQAALLEGVLPSHETPEQMWGFGGLIPTILAKRLAGLLWTRWRGGVAPGTLLTIEILSERSSAALLPGKPGHWVVVDGIRDGFVHVRDPAGLRVRCPQDEFLEKWRGDVVFEVP